MKHNTFISNVRTEGISNCHKISYSRVHCGARRYSVWQLRHFENSCFLPERDYVTFGSLLSQIRLSSVTFERATQGVKTFGNISSPFCTLAILWSPCKILRWSSRENDSVGGVKCRRGNKIERYVTFGYLVSDEFLVIQCSFQKLLWDIWPYLYSVLVSARYFGLKDFSVLHFYFLQLVAPRHQTLALHSRTRTCCATCCSATWRRRIDFIPLQWISIQTTQHREFDT